MTADEIIEQLELIRHPEGGWFRETWRAAAAEGERPAGTMIYFLLAAGERSHWHRVDAAEHWLWHAGAPLILKIAASDAGPAEALRLGPDLAAGERPQGLVPPHFWQSAESCGDWTLVSCAVSPGFDFAGFELAAQSFDIP
ncbi:cupin domain-containing protein [Poseidonocella sp. HB161398]|uniref:cupin domain-containing protein n=1 Tax=Poseidonocella sp. HB161398 TaxID=2320855 RepID=UPI001108B3B7|nr:cupin domain-containing protein [Poseidonocella sp. HB161398]